MTLETPFTPTIRTWRLIRSGALDGSLNMAIDEMLLDEAARALAAEREAPVTLRLYAWEPAAVSLGHHQDEGRLDLARLAREGIPVVRRATGGRAIYHIDELTYAVTGPLSLFGGAASVMDAYRALSGPILEGLGLVFGVRATLARGKRTEHPRRGPTVACFDSPAQCDAVVDGRKLVGSAQCRKGGAFLQHGSLPLVPREARERAVLLGPGASPIESLGCLEETVGRPVTWAEAAEAFVRGYAESAGVTFREEQLSAEEQEVALARATKENARLGPVDGASE